ncbi:MAG: hypothetical protein HC908_04525 [Calothrix sp. SM1_7_51]|nr:hypothetical protein [Calothrix sp. SM1_7_51]
MLLALCCKHRKVKEAQDECKVGFDVSRSDGINNTFNHHHCDRTNYTARSIISCFVRNFAHQRTTNPTQATERADSPANSKCLTQEQRAKFQAELKQGKGVRVTLLSLNLSAQQQKQLRSIFQSTKGQITKTLTSQQQRQIMQNVWSQRQQGL